MGMSTSGYVWFVTDQSGFTAVIPTYGSGTLLVRSRQQHTPVPGLVLGESLKTKTKFGTRSNPDPVAASTSGTSGTSPISGLSHSSPPLNPSTPSRAFHTTPSSLANFSFPTTPSSLFSGSKIIDPTTPERGSIIDMTTLGETLFPLFCISVHECAWITAGYGIWGKEEWLRHFWTVLDWHKVSQAYMKWVPDTTAYI
jgi:Fe-Mn family superoxide dismutase